MSLLGVDPKKWEFRSHFPRNEGVSWDEIDLDSPGRLFVTCDTFLSDGYFMDGYGMSAQNSDAIRSLVRAFSTFKSNLLQLSFRNTITVWPTGEPLTTIVDVRNHGGDVTSAVLRLDVNPECEPLSPLERELSRLRTLERSTFALQVIPRIDGNYSLIAGATAEDSDGRSCEVILELLEVEIAPAIGSPQRSSVIEDDLTLSRLVAVLRDRRVAADVQSLAELARVDARACLNRLRVLAENIVFKALKGEELPIRRRNLDAGIELLRTRQMISNRAVGYLHTVRVIGNIASHDSPEHITDADVRTVAYALAIVVDEFLENDLLFD